jgi:ComF family protein
MASIRRLANFGLDLAFPARCSGCGREGEALCGTCSPALDSRLDLPGGTPIGLPADIPMPLLQLDWCAPFAGTVRSALHDLKYAGERRLAEPLGRAVARRWARIGVGAEIVVPAPIHADRERKRGYDQAGLIAEVAARELSLSFVAALERGRNTVPQFDLGRDQRAANVAGAFRLRGDAWQRPIYGRWILLVDDVVTTGATLAACGTALIDAGAAAVSAIAVAKER